MHPYHSNVWYLLAFRCQSNNHSSTRTSVAIIAAAIDVIAIAGVLAILCCVAVPAVVAIIVAIAMVVAIAVVTVDNHSNSCSILAVMQ